MTGTLALRRPESRVRLECHGRAGPSSGRPQTSASAPGDGTGTAMPLAFSRGELAAVGQGAGLEPPPIGRRQAAAPTPAPLCDGCY